MPIQLTAEEQQLYDAVQVEPHDHAAWVEAGRRTVMLMRSLTARRAIPAVRSRYFIEADFNPGGTTSRREVFARNGCRTDDEIHDHPHFLRYLRYFVEGPQLTEAVIKGFQAIVSDSLREWDALDVYARAKVRELAITAENAGEEFFKLAIESGVPLSEATRIRKSARSAATAARRRRGR